MEKISSENFLQHLEWRYAVKKFNPSRLIDPATWSAIEKSLILTPSSYGLQPWKFLVVKNPELRQKLRAASWNQSQVTDCSHFVVLTYRTSVDAAYLDHYLDTIAQTRGVTKESLQRLREVIAGDVLTGTRSKIIQEWATRQTYIALGNLMTTCAALQVDACPMEGLDPAKYDEILNLAATPFRTAMACAVGYRAEDDFLAKAKKVRFAQTEIMETRD